MVDDSDIVAQDSRRYFMFTKPQRVTRAMHSLEGLLKGIAIDGEISIEEVHMLQKWLEENRTILQHDPFNELKALIDSSLADGRIDEDEKKDILWFCRKFTSDDNYFSAITSDLQRLHGILGGIISDNVIDKNELDGLRSWLDEHQDLRTCWPFDEISRQVALVLEDGRIDDQEHASLLSFFGEFFRFSGAAADGDGPDGVPAVIGSVCSQNPRISFEDRRFCFTGSSSRETRERIQELVSEKGGRIAEKLDDGVDYLVIGANGSPCWTFACYGRKVEEAIGWQKNGADIQIIHEDDFWRAMETVDK